MVCAGKDGAPEDSPNTKSTKRKERLAAQAAAEKQKAEEAEAYRKANDPKVLKEREQARKKKEEEERFTREGWVCVLADDEKFSLLKANSMQRIAAQRISALCSAVSLALVGC
jgi:hypothetical protein